MQNKQNYPVYHQIINIIKSPIFFCFWLGLATFSYFFLDANLATYFNYSAPPLLIELADWITNLGEGTYVITGVILFYFIAYNPIKNKTARNELIFILAAIIIASLICNVLKISLGRARPMAFINENLFGFYFFQFDFNSLMLSFPSGHATTIASLMISLSFFHPRYWKIFFLLILLVSVSRVINDAHFLSDTIAGLYLGAITPIWLKTFIEKKTLALWQPFAPSEE